LYSMGQSQGQAISANSFAIQGFASLRIIILGGRIARKAATTTTQSRGNAQPGHDSHPQANNQQPEQHSSTTWHLCDDDT
jgi:hypothetical protein